MRTIVDLSEAQLQALALLCEEQKISRAEAVRRAVDQMIKESARDRQDVGFGIWKNKRLNGRKFIDKLRHEWDAL